MQLALSSSGHPAQPGPRAHALKQRLLSSSSTHTAVPLLPSSPRQVGELAEEFAAMPKSRARKRAKREEPAAPAAAGVEPPEEVSLAGLQDHPPWKLQVPIPAGAHSSTDLLDT